MTSNTHNERLLRIIITRFAKAVNIMITVPTVQHAVSSRTVKVTVGYLANSTHCPLTVNMVHVLSDYLSCVFGRTVTLVFVRVGTPFADAHLLCQHLSRFMAGSVSASHRFKPVMSRLAKHMTLARRTTDLSAPQVARGVRVRLSGRLTTEPTRPRVTTSEMTIGSFRSNRLQSSSLTSINAKGSMTIKVWLGL